MWYDELPADFLEEFETQSAGVEAPSETKSLISSVVTQTREIFRNSIPRNATEWTHLVLICTNTLKVKRSLKLKTFLFSMFPHSNLYFGKLHNFVSLSKARVWSADFFVKFWGRQLHCQSNSCSDECLTMKSESWHVLCPNFGSFFPQKWAGRDSRGTFLCKAVLRISWVETHPSFLADRWWPHANVGLLLWRQSFNQIGF